MCFAPHRRALLQHRNVQKRSEHGVFCAFSLPNVLRATTAYTFLTSQLPKVVLTWCVLCILTSKCASRHNAMHFFHILTSTRASRMVSPHPPLYRAYFSTLRSHKTVEKHNVSRLTYPVAHLHLLTSDFLHLFSSHFSFSHFGLTFPTVHIVGSLALNFLRSTFTSLQA